MKPYERLMFVLQLCVLALLVICFALVVNNYTPVYEVEVYKDHSVWHTTEKPAFGELSITIEPEMEVGQKWRHKTLEFGVVIVESAESYVVYSYAPGTSLGIDKKEYFKNNFELIGN